MSGFVYLGRIPGTRNYKISRTETDIQTHAKRLDHGLEYVCSVHVTDPQAVKKAIQLRLKPYHHARQDYYVLDSSQIGINAFKEYFSSVHIAPSESADNSDSNSQTVDNSYSRPSGSHYSEPDWIQWFWGVIGFILIWAFAASVLNPNGVKPSQNKNRQGVTHNGLSLLCSLDFSNTVN